MINLTERCCKGSLQHKANISKVKAERSKDFIFYHDYMGEWKFSELVDSLVEDCKFDKESVKEYIFDNLEKLCAFDVPSMYCIIEEELLKEMEQE